MIGMTILVVSGLLTAFYRPVADAFGGSYDRYKLYGLIGCGLGIVVMLNIHTVLLQWLFGSLFGQG